MKLQAVSIIALLLACSACLSPTAAAEPLPSDSRTVNVTAFGAIPNDGLDDTQAIQDAIASPQAAGAAGKIVYLPAGVYDVSDTIVVSTIRETNRVTIVGESEASTVIRLAANAAGFDDPANAKSVLQTSSFPAATAVQFRQSIQDLSVEVGPGNPGAIAIDFHTNNQGFMRNVTARGSGVIGINLGGSDRGPGMLRGITVDGFATGIDAPGTEYSWVFEDITLRNQTDRGIRNFWNILTIRGLFSDNAVPVLWQDVDTPNQFRWAMCTLIDATLIGGSPSSPALLANSAVYLRNVTSQGYGSLLETEGVASSFTSVPGEWSSDHVQRLHPGGDAMLGLPIAEIPPLPTIGPGAANAESFGANGLDDAALDDAPAIQAAIDSGADVVYLPSGRYHFGSTVVLRGSITRLAGLSSSVAAIGPLADSGGPLFTTSGSITATIDNLEMNFTGTYAIAHPGPGTLAIRNITRGASEVTGGDFFLEDVGGGPHRIAAPARGWYRQLNAENTGTKLTNDGADVVVLGIKTEQDGRLVQNNGGRTEILGGLAYPLSVSLGEPMFVNNEGELSVIIGESAYGGSTPSRIPDHEVIVDDIRNGELRRITDSELPTRIGFGLGAKMSYFTSNSQPPPSLDGPYAAFDFESFTSGRTQSSIGAFDASLEDGAVPAAGVIGNGVEFDGTSWLFFTPDAPTLPLSTSEGAIELWVNSDAAFTDSAMLFYGAAERVAGPNGFGNALELHTHFNADGTIGFFIESAAGDVNISTDQTFNDGQWHHVVASWDTSGRAELFVNGTRRASVQREIDVYPLQSVVLARTNSTNRRYTGRIDEVTLYGRAITHSEVISRYNGTRGFANYAPIVEAGTSQVVQTSTSAWQSNAQVSDDGQPLTGTLTTEWQTLAGPGAVAISGPDPVAPTLEFPGPGDYVLSLTADDGLESTSDTVEYAVFEPLPTPWRNDDINTGEAGWATTTDGTDFVVNGTGVRIGGSPNNNGDSFHFVYQESFDAQDLEIAATINRPTGGGTNAVAAVMLRGGQREYIPEIDRQVISNVAENAMIGLTAGGDLVYQNRPGNGGGTTVRVIETGVTGPVHVRLLRTSTNRARAFYALDCSDSWTELEEVTINRGQAQTYIGMAVTGGGGLATGVFKDVTVRASAPGDVNADTRLDFFDVTELLRLLDAGDASADLDGSGVLDSSDVLLLLDRIQPPCTTP
ncbi:MAG: glycosyl hydrolase family 28-related protein [Planctomycetota bacterium]